MHISLLSQLDIHIDYIRSQYGLDDIFVVGGAVRDIILGKKDHIVDVDFTMKGDPDEIRSKITSVKKVDGVDIFRTEKFGTMTIIVDSSNLGLETKQKIKYEITPLREESGYQDHRHPDKIVRSDSVVADASRRDFTINAMYYYKSGSLQGSDILNISDTKIIGDIWAGGIYDHDIFISYCKQNNIAYDDIGGILLDPYGGIDDIHIGKIRTVGDADSRLSEDPLRILRALRFQNAFSFSDKYDLGEDNSFDFEKYTRQSMKKSYFLVRTLSKERIHEEIIKVFSGPNPFGYVSLLDELNILKYIFPSVYSIKGLAQPVRYHPFDVYSHTLLSLYALQQINSDPLVRLAMLYHDVGKTEQYYSHSLNLPEQDRSFIYGSWLNHTNAGPDMVKEDFAKIGFGNKEIETIARYVALHMKPGEILFSAQENQPKKIRTLLSEADFDKCNNLLDICMGDRLGHYNPIQKPETAGVERLRSMLSDIYNSEGQFTMGDMKINGLDIMKHFGIEGGPEVGDYLKKALDRVLGDPNTRNNKKQIFNHLDKIKKH